MLDGLNLRAHLTDGGASRGTNVPSSSASYAHEGNFWIPDNAGLANGTHVAFTARERSTVDEFHRAAVAAGGVDNDAPGIRHHYHEPYYTAYVLDPDGINVEVVCQTLT